MKYTSILNLNQNLKGWSQLYLDIHFLKLETNFPSDRNYSRSTNYDSQENQKHIFHFYIIDLVPQYLSVSRLLSHLLLPRVPRYGEKFVANEFSIYFCLPKSWHGPDWPLVFQLVQNWVILISDYCFFVIKVPL